MTFAEKTGWLQVLEAFVSKLFALSYSTASLEIHGSTAADHFTHCMTQRCILCIGKARLTHLSSDDMRAWLQSYREQNALPWRGSLDESYWAGRSCQ